MHQTGCVLQFLLSDMVELPRDTLCSICESDIMCCTRAIFPVRHATHTLCVAQYKEAHQSNFMCCMRVSLLVCCMQVNCHPFPEKNQGIQRNGMQAKHDKMCGHTENSILSSIYVFLFQSFQSTLDFIVINQHNANHHNDTGFIYRLHKH